MVVDESRPGTGRVRPFYEDNIVSMKRIQSKRPSILVGQRTLDLYGEKDEGPKFVKWMIGCFNKWGHFISKYPWTAIITVLVISTVCNIKIFFTPQRNDVTGYTPYGARAKDEFDAYNRFFASQGTPVATYIFAIAKDNGSMIRPEYLDEFVEIINDAQSNFTIYDDLEKKEENFNEFCKSFCLANEPIRQFHGALKILSDGGPITARIKLNYPISNVLGTSFSLQPNFYGVERYNDTDPADPVHEMLGGGDNNETAQVHMRRITNLKSVKMVSMMLRAEQKKGWNDDKVKEFEMKVVNAYKDHKSDRLQVYVVSQTYVEEEMVRGGKIMLPYLVVGFIIMCACSCLTVMIRALYMHQVNCYKVILAITACITPLMATATALCLMFLCGVRFASILCVIPFLVLSIGVDSSYLMIHEWQRVTKHAREGNLKGDTVGRRMAEVLSEVGPAIVISCLTNMFADAVGSFTSSPEITMLCTGNMISMCIAFIYQMTFYAGLMVIVGRKEINDDTLASSTLRLNVSENKVNLSRTQRQLTRTNSKFHDNAKPIVSKFMQRYVDGMASGPISMFVVFCYLVYIAISIWGITRLNINLSPKKLFAADSPLSELDDLRVKYVIPHFSVATVFVTRPGNLSDPNQLNLVNQLIRDFERLNGSWGPDGTKYFMRDFQNFEESFNDENDYGDMGDTTTVVPLEPTKFNPYDLQHFLKWPEYDFWAGFVQLRNTSDPGLKELEQFFFTTGFHGQQLTIWRERGKMLHEWRDVIDRYPELGASVYHEDGVYLDLIDNMPTDTWQSVLGTLVCMGLVCFVFLNNIFTVSIAALSVLSICIGILGIISWMGTDLDPITMAAMIISIGFSVDIPAHVSYHYYQASIQHGPSSRPSDRLANCLSSVAFPAVQAALSTTLCVCSLLFINLYMAQVFVRIMIICVVLCNLHGLLFLPAILICLDRVRWAFRPKGAAAQRPRANGQNASNPKRQKGQIAPEKSSIPDRPDV